MWLSFDSAGDPAVALNDVMECTQYVQGGCRHGQRPLVRVPGRATARDIRRRLVVARKSLKGAHRRYGDPRVSTIVREHLSRFVGVVSFSADPLIPTMWAHYAENSGFVVGYRTDAIRPRGVGLRRVLYMELAPAYWPESTSVPQFQGQASASCGRARSGGEWVVKRSSRGRRSKTLRLQHLEHLVEAPAQPQDELEVGQQQVHAGGHPQLRQDRILRPAHEAFHL